MSFSTIKGKLTLLLVVLALGFCALGYEIIKEGNDAKMAATRLVTIANIEKLTLELRIEQRNYQVNFQVKNLEQYEKIHQQLLKDLDDLKRMLLSKVNHDRIDIIKKLLTEWHTINAPRMALYTKHGKEIYDEHFSQNHKEDAKKLEELYKPSTEAYNLLLDKFEELAEEVKKSNFNRLDTNKLMSEIALTVVMLIVFTIFFFVTRSIKNSVARAKESCEIMRENKDLSSQITLNTKDEINEIMDSVNSLINDVARALNAAKENAIENASVAEELSSTSLQIGKRAEEEAKVVFETTNDAKEVANAIVDASVQSQNVKESTSHAQKSLLSAQNLLNEAKEKANAILRSATDNAKSIVVETEELKNKTRLFHQRLKSTVESQLSLINSSEWEDILRPTATYLQTSDEAFREVLEKVLEETPAETSEEDLEITRQLTPEELEELQRHTSQMDASSHRENEEYQETE